MSPVATLPERRLKSIDFRDSLIVEGDSLHVLYHLPLWDRRADRP
jgi:hypothetical protein